MAESALLGLEGFELVADVDISFYPHPCGRTSSSILRFAGDLFTDAGYAFLYGEKPAIQCADDHIK